MCSFSFNKALLNRFHNICNTYINKHKEIQNIFESLLCNGYPKSFINKHIKQFLIKFQFQNNSAPQSNTIDQPLKNFLYLISLCLRNFLSTVQRNKFFFPKL